MDVSPSSNSWLEDVSQVEKFTMPDEEYDKLENSFRAFRRQMQAGKKEKKVETDVEIKCDINVGDRCQVDPGEKRGTVKYVRLHFHPHFTSFHRFVGSVAHLKSGIWIGIEYDEPIGKNDGCINGERFFTCQSSHGAFVRPTKVRVGDFPPFDDFPDEL